MYTRQGFLYLPFIVMVNMARLSPGVTNARSKSPLTFGTSLHTDMSWICTTRSRFIPQRSGAFEDPKSIPRREGPHHAEVQNNLRADRALVCHLAVGETVILLTSPLHP